MRKFFAIIALAISLPASLAAQHHISYRGDYSNFVYKAVFEKKATVAFLGGSITEMKGWRDMMKEALTKKYPDTRFTFIEAGIASLGSTPHAFRFAQDVLAHGTPDLLFVEAAVNDHTNGFGPREQVCGMEGIVRHALKANPCMDIMMLHFIYDPFIPEENAGRIPDVVLNHERVANRYGITSIDLVTEIAERMRAGEFTWEEFGGTHPAPLGHSYYSAAINDALAATAVPAAGYKVRPHEVPAEPIEKFNYENGRFQSIETAVRLKGFSIDPSWEPIQKSGLRPGFHGVPMLTSDKGGSSFEVSFDGSAIGLCMVAGPDAAPMQYRVDKGEWKTLDPYTEWSGGLYIPWVYMLEDELEEGTHTLQLRTVRGERGGCHIRNFAVN